MIEPLAALLMHLATVPTAAYAATWQHWRATRSAKRTARIASRIS